MALRLAAFLGSLLLAGGVQGAPVPPPEPTSALQEAARRGDAAGVLASLERGGDPLAPDDDGLTPLALAIRSGSADAVAALLTSGSGAYLDPTLDVRTPEGRRAREDGDLPAARSLLAGLVRSHPNNESMVFAHAMACLSMRDFAQAEFALNRLIADINPDNLRARRELAHLYALTGRPALARRELELLLMSLPSAPMRSSIRSDLAELRDGARRWTRRLRLRTGVVHDSNANAGPDSDWIEIQPLTIGPLVLTELRLAPESRPVRATGAYYALDGEVSRALGRQGPWSLAAEFGLRGTSLPDERDFESLHWEGGAALRRNRERSALQARLSGGQVFHGRESLVRQVSLRPSATVVTGGNGQWWWTTEGLMEFRNYDDLDARDGHYIELTQSVRRFLGPSRHHVHAAAGWRTDQTDSGFYRYDAPSLELGVNWILPARLSAFGSVRWQRRSYSQSEPLAPRRRVDTQWACRAGIRWRMTPRWEWEAAWQRLDTNSSFDLYDVTRDVFTAGIAYLLY